MSEDPKLERLNRAMRHWADEVGEVNPPAALEQSLLGEFVRVHAARRRRRWVSAFGIAAAAIISLWIAFKPVTEPANLPIETAAAPTVAEEPFVAIPYVTSPSPSDRMEIVRMEMPAAALIAAGLKVPAVDPGSRVQADVMVGQDGRAHAIRLVASQF